jgi:ADP-heptose:LPS heptosyltransferase
MSGVLIIKLGALGDIVMAAPLVRSIITAHAGEAVAVLTADEYREIFTRWPSVTVQAFPRRGARAMTRAILWVRRGRFRRIYDLQSSDRSALLCALGGARERVGNHPRFPYTHHPAEPWTGAGHIHDRWRDVLRSAGIDPGRSQAWLPVTAAEHDEARRFTAEHGLHHGAFAILHAGASPAHPEKCWPGFGDLAAALRAADLGVVWAGAGADTARNRELAGRHGGVDASGAFSLTGLAALGMLARFAVTNDSAPMHALACAGIPVFGLFGPTDWRRNHAIGQRNHVIAASGDGGAFRPASLSKLAVPAVLARLRDAGMLGAG